MTRDEVLETCAVDQTRTFVITKFGKKPYIEGPYKVVGLFEDFLWVHDLESPHSLYTKRLFYEHIEAIY